MNASALYTRLHHLWFASVEPAIYGLHKSMKVPYEVYEEEPLSKHSSEYITQDVSAWGGFVTQIYSYAEINEWIKVYKNTVHMAFACHVYDVDHGYREEKRINVIVEKHSGRILSRLYKRSLVKPEIIRDKQYTISSLFHYDTSVDTIPTWQQRMCEAVWKRLYPR